MRRTIYECFTSLSIEFSVSNCLDIILINTYVYNVKFQKLNNSNIPSSNYISNVKISKTKEKFLVLLNLSS